MKKELLLMVGLSIFPSNFPSNYWINWSGNHTCDPEFVHHPKTVEELCAVVKDAAASHKIIRVAGKGYSRSDLVCTQDCLIYLNELNRVLSVDTKNNDVWVEAGISIERLNSILADHGLALSNQAAASEITLGGALATASHGTGHTGTLSSFIKEVQLVTADGNLISISKESDPQLLAAARVSLGALGVIYAVKLQCEQLFYVESKHIKLPFTEVISNYKSLYENNDFFQFIWEIESDVAFVDIWNKSATDSIAHKNHQTEVCHTALAWFHTDDTKKDLASEIAIPLEKLAEALDCIKQIHTKYKQKDMLITNIVVRFAKGDNDALLSPASEKDVAYINVWAPVDSRYDCVYQDVEDALMAFGGRPHWGKIHFLNFDKGCQLYGDNFLRFISVKKAMDPHSIFSNASLERIFTK